MEGPWTCPIYKVENETTNHLFTECGFSKVVWTIVKEYLNLNLAWGEGSLHEIF